MDVKYYFHSSYHQCLHDPLRPHLSTTHSHFKVKPHYFPRPLSFTIVNVLLHLSEKW